MFQILVSVAPLIFTIVFFAVRGHGKEGINYAAFQDDNTGVTLNYVSNSGICEQTPGVGQYSGYADFGNNNALFWWFFEARNNPTTAPLALWLNGGPGCSSLIGLFQENGPCLFTNESTSSITSNEYSWNNVANMLYLDQPFGTGFSTSNGILDVNSTYAAETYVWQFFQAFFMAFPDYENHNFGLFTESYGGHYGPAFADYFEQQNVAIGDGTINGVEVKMVALGINDGWFEPISQYKSLIDYAYTNPYRSLISQATADILTGFYNTTCKPALDQCSQTSSDFVCMNADGICENGILEGIINSSDFDVYDLREGSNDTFPLQTYQTYLSDPSVMTAIGANTNYQACSNVVPSNFYATGDHARSTVGALDTILTNDSDVQVLIWAGTADWICNVAGVEAVVAQLTFPQSADFSAMSLTNYTVNGNVVGEFKTAGKLSFLEVFDAGHEVPAYQPAAALQAFNQTINRQALYST